ncbi:MAG TPA: DUF3631 domain-containing protein [Candidatus Angelobacter sp.]
MKSTREYLSKLLPKFNKQTNAPKRKLDAAPPRAAEAEMPLPAVKQPAAALNPVELLDSIAKFLRQYLVCDEHQFTILALWIAHTWCFRNFSTAAYLHIRSADSQSAKTLCLKLLAALSDSPWLATGTHWRSIMDNLLTPARRVTPGKPFAGAPPYTIFLDDCHHTFASTERQPVLALLNSGSQSDCSYVEDLHRYNVFGPKAFAGNRALPRSLAARCIPILFRRKKPSDLVARFNPHAASSAAHLAHELASWAAANSAVFAKIAFQPPSRVPPGFSARELDCAEPLLHIADHVGGPWPERARVALAAAFKLADDSLALELLSDIRALFFLKEDPACLATRDLLTMLIGVEHRPWGAWKNGSGSARRLAALLHPFGIIARNFNKGSGSNFRGYKRESFLDVWERYLPPIPADWPETRAQMKKEAEAVSATTS